MGFGLRSGLELGSPLHQTTQARIKIRVGVRIRVLLNLPVASKEPGRHFLFFVLPVVRVRVTVRARTKARDRVRSRKGR